MNRKIKCPSKDKRHLMSIQKDDNGIIIDTVCRSCKETVRTIITPDGDISVDIVDTEESA